METITSRRNPLCLHMKMLGASGSYRDETCEFLCDGAKLLEEAVTNGAEVTAVLAASRLPFQIPANTRVFFAERGIIDSLSPLKNGQDTLFTCKIPREAKLTEMRGTHILLDGMQDPGNIGAIIRTASAFGIKSVILTGNCADLYNPKTIRASMGAIFRQEIYRFSIEKLAKLVEAEGVRLIAAMPADGVKELTDVSLKDSIIAIGNEGHGLSAEVLALCGEKVTIRLSPGCESLNAAAAAAIIIWEAARQTAARAEISIGCGKQCLH